MSFTTPNLGDVVGPASATDNAVARFDTTTGKLLQNGLVVIDDLGGVSGAVNLTATGNVALSASGSLTLGQGALVFPAADGAAGQVLTTNGASSLSFTSMTQGLVQQGAVTADPAPAVGNSIYTVNSTGGAFGFTLPVSTGSGARIITVSTSMNAVTLAVPAGEFLNGILNGTMNIAPGAFTQTQIVDVLSGSWSAITSSYTSGPCKFYYSQPSATNGGAIGGPINTWITYPLNTTAVNNPFGATLAATQITVLDPGFYSFTGMIQINKSGLGQVRLRDVTNGTTIANSTYSAKMSLFNGQMTFDVSTYIAAANTVFEIQYNVSINFGPVALGTARSSGEPEVYGNLSVTKLY